MNPCPRLRRSAPKPITVIGGTRATSIAPSRVPQSLRFLSHFCLRRNVVPAVNQFYESQVYDMYVIRGNAAVFKCHIPSFVSDHVHVVSWHDTEGGEYSGTDDYGSENN